MRGSSARLATAILTFLALFALTGWQVTGETAASRFLGRIGAAIIELDRWVPAHAEDVRLLARDKNDGLLQLRDVPIDITLPAAAIAASDDQSLRSLIRNEMGRVLYDRGNSAFIDSEGAEASIGVTESVRWAVSLLGRGMHGFWLAALVLTTLLLLAAGAAVLSTGQMPLQAMAIGALTGVGLSLAVWVLMKPLSESAGGAVDKEIFLILRDGAWLGVRNSAAVAFAAGVVAFVAGLGRGQSPRERYSAGETQSRSIFSR
jgi:hypothetical protein